MLLHAGAAHVTANLFWQIIVGIPLEMVHGPGRIFVLYVLGGLAGSFSVSIFDKNTNIVGASAGCYALVGAHVANIIKCWTIMPFPLIRLLVFTLIFSIDVVLSAYRRYAENDTSVSFSSHLAGALLGLTLGGVILNGLDQHENSADNDDNGDNHPSCSSTCRLVTVTVKNYGGLVLVIFFFCFCIAFNVVSPQKT
mmetsp:Transcript_27829/g.38867  ORF Transcript_27829/g.38867 Transcript_27829/m.38867 type:complete len:196 (+) Transcript_27829:227-814(+)